MIIRYLDPWGVRCRQGQLREKGWRSEFRGEGLGLRVLRYGLEFFGVIGRGFPNQVPT